MLLSIIIPCYNSSATIQRAVDSVLAQTYHNWELILVDNNSTDNTLRLLLKIQNNNPEKKITVLEEKKKGAPAARNKGLFAAKGEWIQFLDADDELLPDKLEIQIEQISHKIDAIYSPYFFIKTTDIQKSYIIKNDIWEALLMSKIGITSSNLFRKKALLDINGWQEDLSSSQDTRLIFDLLKRQNILLPLDSHLANVYATDASITRTADKKKIKKIIGNYISLRKDILKFLSENGKNIDKYKTIYNRVLADCYLWYFENSPFYTLKEYNKQTNHNLINRLKINYSFAVKLIRKPAIIKNIF